MFRKIEHLFERQGYPLQVLGGRDIGAGHLRGWGLEYGSLLQNFLASDPVYRAAFAAARDRGSMLQEHNLANLYLIIRYAMGEGDLYEFGSFSGGSAVFMAPVLKELRMPAKVFAFDTYQGMPETDATRDMHHKGDFANADYDGLLAYISGKGLGDYVETVKGEFSATLPGILRRNGKKRR